MQQLIEKMKRAVRFNQRKRGLEKSPVLKKTTLDDRIWRTLIEIIPISEPTQTSGMVFAEKKVD